MTKILKSMKNIKNLEKTGILGSLQNLDNQQVLKFLSENLSKLKDVSLKNIIGDLFEIGAKVIIKK